VAGRASKLPGVATDSGAAVATPGRQIPPPWPPAFVPVATSRCEPHRALTEAQVRLGRNGMAIYQDLVDLHGFIGAYNSIKRFVAKLRHKEPDRFDRLSFLTLYQFQYRSEVETSGFWNCPRMTGHGLFAIERLAV